MMTISAVRAQTRQQIDEAIGAQRDAVSSAAPPPPSSSIPELAPLPVAAAHTFSAEAAGGNLPAPQRFADGGCVCIRR